MLCIGLTGNIGSGKSTIAMAFSRAGVDVISADQIAKDLIDTPTSAVNEIIAHFGTSLLTPEGTIDRRLLRQIIVNNIDERRWLEALLHPLIRQQIQGQVAASQSEYCLIEIPLLFERLDYPYINRVLVITADFTLRRLRIQSRDQCSQDEALAIMATQPSTEAYQAIADDEIDNSGSHEAIEAQVKTLHQQYSQLAKG